MALSPRERAVITAHLNVPANVQYILGELKTGRGKTIPVKRENFEAIQWWLKSMLVLSPDDAGVMEVATLIQEKCPPRPAVLIETALPAPLDVAKEKLAVTRDCAYAETIRGIYVQLDIDQNKHQPAGIPIGTREIHGEKFGDYATKEWHKTHTMDYMATWAAGLPPMIEGKKIEHGQSKRVSIDDVDRPCCFEGFCVLLGGTKYVSFHCYPNSK